MIFKDSPPREDEAPSNIVSENSESVMISGPCLSPGENCSSEVRENRSILPGGEHHIKGIRLQTASSLIRLVRVMGVL